jgi:hypothetical protein
MMAKNDSIGSSNNKGNNPRPKPPEPKIRTVLEDITIKIMDETSK